MAVDDDGHAVMRADGNHELTTTPEGKEDATVTISIYDNDGHANRLSDEPAVQTQTLIHYRGNSSRRFPKRNYSLHFVDENGENASYEAMGMPADNGWILKGPYLDKSLLRNYLSYTVFSSFTNYAPRVRFCELFVDGTYRGVFLFMEAVDVGENRIPLTEGQTSVNAVQDGGVETSYLLRLDRYDMDAQTIDSLGSQVGLIESSMAIEYPNQLDLTEAQKTWITRDFSAFEKALYSYDYDTAEYGYANYIDVDSFIGYFIANEFSLNSDAGLYSTYLYRDVRGKICIGPIWDFNNAYDNYVEYDYSDASGFTMVDRPWYTMLFRDEDFCKRVIKRYRQLRRGVLSDEYLQAFIDDALDYLGPAIERKWRVWGSSFDITIVDEGHRLEPLDRNPKTFEEAVADLKDFIGRRGSWLDRNIENLRQ
ncbi:CotH kinase family protein [Collinsella tanakaei]|uniref:CotH kinase family protein n=1 Tax=Collinsella tanakaei TaxID=626935 RepID=UPI001958DEA9|nr:CotH kinase family protein [Collinsella tanakaei]